MPQRDYRLYNSEVYEISLSNTVTLLFKSIWPDHKGDLSGEVLLVAMQTMGEGLQTKREFQSGLVSFILGWHAGLIHLEHIYLGVKQ